MNHLIVVYTFYCVFKTTKELLDKLFFKIFKGGKKKWK